jgi:hypothetical protein
MIIGIACYNQTERKVVKEILNFPGMLIMILIMIGAGERVVTGVGGTERERRKPQAGIGSKHLRRGSMIDLDPVVMMSAKGHAHLGAAAMVEATRKKATRKKAAGQKATRQKIMRIHVMKPKLKNARTVMINVTKSAHQWHHQPH